MLTFCCIEIENALFQDISSVFSLFKLFADSHILWQMSSKKHNILWCFSSYSTCSIALGGRKLAFCWLQLYIYSILTSCNHTYHKIAPEVFMRIVQNRKAAEKHYRRIKEYAPKTGVVRMLRLTEKQYDNITMITGEPDYQEQTVGTNCHIMI